MLMGSTHHFSKVWRRIMRLLTQLNPRTRVRTNRDGTTIAETAVVLPVFFIVVFGIFEFGHVFMTIHEPRDLASAKLQQRPV
jgi:Flp pilus assembly protein TadG